MALLTLQDLAWGIGATSGAPTGGVWDCLTQRQDLEPKIYQWIADSILELSRDYRFNLLEKTGPLVSLIAGQASYDYSYFTILASKDIPNLVPSFYIYYEPYPPTSINNNPGTVLQYKTIDSLELMFNTPGTPAYWSRFENKIWIAPVPIQAYYGYMRYQKQSPFSSPPIATDPYLMPDEWREIVEYAAAMRGAIKLRMLDYAAQYHTILFGDPEFQRSSGGTGQPGLIARRVTQIESDSTSQMRQLRPQIRRY